MDWSLVLVSQEIENMIQPPGEDHGWQVVVGSQDYARAMESIQAYRHENRARRWRQEFPLGDMVFDWHSVIWYILIAVFFTLSQTNQTYLPTAGVMDAEEVRQGQWWRLFTAVTLHADVSHLVANVTFGILLLGLAMGSFGPGIALLGSYLAGVGGNVILLLVYATEHRSLGASGMVMGSLGLLAGQSLALLGTGMTTRQLIMRSLFAGFLLLVLFGLNPSTDVVAHVGGFVSGVILGALLGWVAKRFMENLWVNRLAETLCGAAVIVSWWFALKHL